MLTECTAVYLQGVLTGYTDRVYRVKRRAKRRVKRRATRRVTLYLMAGKSTAPGNDSLVIAMVSPFFTPANMCMANACARSWSVRLMVTPT